MFDFLPVVNVRKQFAQAQEQARKEASDADQAQKAQKAEHEEKAAKVDEGAAAQQQAAEQAAAHPPMDPLDRTQSLTLLRQLKEKWEALLRSGDQDHGLSKEASTYLQQLANLDSFNVQDLELLRKMSQLKAKDEPPAGQPAAGEAHDAKTEVNPAQKALQQLRDQIRRLSPGTAEARANPSPDGPPRPPVVSPSPEPAAPPKAAAAKSESQTPAPAEGSRPGEAAPSQPSQPWLLRLEKLPPGTRPESQAAAAAENIKTRLRTGGPNTTAEAATQRTELKTPPKAEPPQAEIKAPLPPKPEPPKAEPPKAEIKAPPALPPKPELPKAEPPKAETKAPPALPSKPEPPKAEPPKAEIKAPPLLPPKPEPPKAEIKAPPALPPKPEPPKAEPPKAEIKAPPALPPKPEPPKAEPPKAEIKAPPLLPPKPEPPQAEPPKAEIKAPPLMTPKPEPPKTEIKAPPLLPPKAEPPKAEIKAPPLMPPKPGPPKTEPPKVEIKAPPLMAPKPEPKPEPPKAELKAPPLLEPPKLEPPKAEIKAPPALPELERPARPEARQVEYLARRPVQPPPGEVRETGRREPAPGGLTPPRPELRPPEEQAPPLKPIALPRVEEPKPEKLEPAKAELKEELPPPKPEPKPKPFQPLTAGKQDALERIARQRQEKAAPKPEAPAPETQTTAVDLKQTKPEAPRPPVAAPPPPPDPIRDKAPGSPERGGTAGTPAEPTPGGPVVRSSFLSARPQVAEQQLQAQAPVNKAKEKELENPATAWTPNAEGQETRAVAGGPPRGGAGPAPTGRGQSGPPIEQIRKAEAALSGSVGRTDDERETRTPPREPEQAPPPRPEILRSRDANVPTSRFLTPAPPREKPRSEEPSTPPETLVEPPTLGPTRERHAVRPADPFGSMAVQQGPPKPDPRTDPKARESWLHPTREQHEQRVHAEVTRGHSQEWMASNPGESAHLMQAVLPGETRRVVTQRLPEDNLFLAPAMPRGPASGTRPVTSNVPIFNPTLDQVWAGAGVGKRTSNSDKIEGIKMTLSGSAGTMEDNPWQQMTLRNPGNLSTMRDLRRMHDLNRDLSQSEDTPRRWAQEQPQESHTLMGMMTSASVPPPAVMREQKPAAPSAKTEGGTSHAADGAGTVIEESGEKGHGGGGGGGSSGGGEGEGGHEEGRAQAQEQRQRASSRPSHGQGVVEKGRLEALRQARENENLRLQMSRHTAPNSRQMADLASRVACHSLEALLKKAYRDQELDQLDEESAVNCLCLVLKMGGEFTYAHSARVLEMALELADEYGITDERTRRQIKGGCMLKDIGEMGILLEGEADEKLDAMAEFMSGQDMRRAGILHDIGKIRIPPEILYKPGRLTEDEYNIMKMHPIYGEQIVYPIASLRHLCPTIRGHHERWDGKGYPDGMREEEIPLPARVIAVADVFDALAAERPYKAGMPIEKVRAILLEGRGSHFDPDLIDAYMRVLDRRYPELARQRRKAAG